MSNDEQAPNLAAILDWVAADAYASGMLDLSIEKERGFIRERLAEAVLASHEQLHTIFGLLRRL